MDSTTLLHRDSVSFRHESTELWVNKSLKLFNQNLIEETKEPMFVKNLSDPPRRNTTYAKIKGKNKVVT